MVFVGQLVFTDRLETVRGIDIIAHCPYSQMANRALTAPTPSLMIPRRTLLKAAGLATAATVIRPAPRRPTMTRSMFSFQSHLPHRDHACCDVGCFPSPCRRKLDCDARCAAA